MIERLRLEMIRQGLNARELADMAHVGRSFVYDLLSGKSSNPTTKKMAAIAEALKVSLPYLIVGSNDNLTNAIIWDDYCAIPILSVNTEDTGILRNYLFHKKWLHENLGATHDNLRVAFIDCDSMSPTLNKNDMVLVDISCKSPSKPGIFILLNGISATPKRIEFIPGKGSNRVFVLSDNTRYLPHTCNLDEIEVIGKVVWISRSMN